MTDYLTIKEAADLLRVKPDTIRKRIQSGVFQRGVHYFGRKGMKPLFKREALVAWLECKEEPDRSVAQTTNGLPIQAARGYTLGG